MTDEEIKKADAEMCADIVRMVGDAIGNPEIPPCNYNDVMRDLLLGAKLAVDSIDDGNPESARDVLTEALKNAGHHSEHGGY